MARRIAWVLEYEGTDYAGFQLQPDAPTVQGVVEDAVERLTGARSRVHGAGRTDAGVHASGQVAAFDTESSLAVERFGPGLNHYLPRDVAVRATHEVPVAFDPRRHATARVYRYTFMERTQRSPLRGRYVHSVGRKLDVATMAEALACLEGEHDFAPFCGQPPQGGSTVRRLYRAQVERGDGEAADEVCVELEGNAFLHQQVRRIAGAARDVGLGKMTVVGFQALASSGERGAAQQVLPPGGLCLLEVKYPAAQAAAAPYTAVHGKGDPVSQQTL